MPTDAAVAPPFQLSKWYLDCLNEEGDGAILYLAELRWRKLHLRYANRLLFVGRNITGECSIRDSPMPQRTDSEIAVNVPQLKAEGMWQQSADSVRAKVFANPEGEIEWNCVQPSSNVELRVDTKEIIGQGYAEVLVMTIPPWKLPLSELHWGRFISASSHVVWIDWRGPHQFQLLESDGERHEAKSISETEIRFGRANALLTLDRGLVLRSGRLGETVLPAISPLARLLPRSLFGIHECKLRSRAQLKRNGAVEKGWAIHEVVRWRSQ